MTDTKLQTLKQRWEASGAIEDEAAWLRERAMRGALSLERLGLAGECGHPAARMALGLSDAQLTATAWLDTVCARGVEVCTRLAVAAAGGAIGRFEAGPVKQAIKRAVDDLEFYLYGTPGESQVLPKPIPCPDGLQEPKDDGWEAVGSAAERGWCLWRCAVLARQALTVEGSMDDVHAKKAVRMATLSLPADTPRPRAAQVLRGVRASLLEYALGYTPKPAKPK
ncbi:MAG: hypothetical protein R3F62_24110 [Planctomycetota bacterium]